MAPQDIPQGWAILTLHDGKPIGGYVEVVHHADGRVEVQLMRRGFITYCNPQHIVAARMCSEEEALET